MRTKPHANGKLRSRPPEMDWLIEDIQRNGVAATAQEAEARPVPDYQEPAERQCPTD